MIKKIVLSIGIILMMIGTAMARIEPAYVRVDQFGIEPAEWLALIVILFATIDNLGRFFDMKRANPGTKYDYAYAKMTFIAILVAGQAQLQIPVVELGIPAIIGAVLLGMGGNVVVTKSAKGIKAMVNKNGST